jgi:hypothetical protein
MTAAPLPGTVDGSDYGWPDPPTAPAVERDSKAAGLYRPVDAGLSASTAPSGNIR